MSPAIRERSTVPHPSLRVRWGLGIAITLAALVWGGNETFPLLLALGAAWAIWRGERDSGRNP